MYHEYRRDNFLISTDPALLNVETIHAFLTQSYWARGIPQETVIKSIQNSLCFGLFTSDRQIGFARAITDYSTFAYLSDVFILTDYQGRGLGQWLIECIIACPSIQGIRRLLLATEDAQEFYQKCGFEPLNKPENFMEIQFFGVYLKPESAHE
jgi:N-acetylglutamate synthase-like GNAT family acetyltransferase